MTGRLVALGDGTLRLRRRAGDPVVLRFELADVERLEVGTGKVGRMGGFLRGAALAGGVPILVGVLMAASPGSETDMALVGGVVWAIPAGRRGGGRGPQKGSGRKRMRAPTASLYETGCLFVWCDVERVFRAPCAPRGWEAYSPCSRKEVIQPQVPLRLPCYDFAPVTELAFGRSLQA